MGQFSVPACAHLVFPLEEHRLGLWIISPNLPLLHQINWFYTANVTALQKGEKIISCEKWLLGGVLQKNFPENFSKFTEKYQCYSLFLIQWKVFTLPGLQFIEKTQPTFKRRINIVLMLWIYVEIALIRRWKWNKIRRRIFNVALHWYNVGVRCWNNVDTTLSQRCFNVASTLVKALSKPVGLVISTDL